MFRLLVSYQNQVLNREPTDAQSRRKGRVDFQTFGIESLRFQARPTPCRRSADGRVKNGNYPHLSLYLVTDCSMLFKAYLIYLAIVFTLLQAVLSLLFYFVLIVLFSFDNQEISVRNITWSSVRYRTILTINLRTVSQILLFLKSWTRRQFVYYEHCSPTGRFIRRPV